VHNYTPAGVRVLLAAQEKKRIAGETPTPTFVIFDDIAGTDIGKDKGVQACFAKGRHDRLFTCVAAQQANTSLAPIFKTNASYIVFSKLPPKALGGLLDEMTLEPEMGPKSFKRWVAKHCERYTFALYDYDRCSLSLLRA